VGESGEVWHGTVQDGIEGWVKVGWEFDACLGVSLSSWSRTMTFESELTYSDRELRTLVLKSTCVPPSYVGSTVDTQLTDRLINLLSLMLLSLLPIILSPILASNPSAQSRTKEIGMWYNLLLSWPVFATCFLINVRRIRLSVSLKGRRRT
jgi:hypothetical protein